MTDDWHVSNCWKCKVRYAIPRTLYDLARQRGNDLTIYCPNGHGGVYTMEETEVDALRRERDKLKQEQAWYADRLREEQLRGDTARRQVTAAKGQITKLKKRASNGVCPCCNRSFSDLARHMHNKHPEFVTEPDATEHAIN